MPSVINKKGKVVQEYPYNKKGIEHAKQHALRIGGTVSSSSGEEKKTTEQYAEDVRGAIGYPLPGGNLMLQDRGDVRAHHTVDRRNKRAQDELARRNKRAQDELARRKAAAKQTDRGSPRSPAAIKKKYGDTPKGRAALKAARKRADRGSPKPSNVKRERVFRDKSEYDPAYDGTPQEAAIADLYKAGMSFGPLATTEYTTGANQPNAKRDKSFANKHPRLPARRYPTDPTPVKADATQKPPPPKDNRRGRGRPPRISTTAALKEEMASVQRERQRKLKRKKKY
jgi:hypothetical protein